MIVKRRLPVGAEVLRSGDVHFRLWAPKPKRVKLVLEAPRDGIPLEIEMKAEQNGYFSCTVSQDEAGDRYRFKLDDADGLFPDPVSRYQPEGPHGPSQIVDPTQFKWTDSNWTGIPEHRVLYEMHIGTFTPEGTFIAATRELKELAELGITVIEVMPIAEFDGEFGWGYDGVALFAPYHHYGKPDDFRNFVDTAHASGIGVILDVVYNHCGPSGSYKAQFSEDYYTDRYECEWGDAFNFDGENSKSVREYFIANACYWIDEFHLDGLRLDATQLMCDNSEGEHIIAAIVREARKTAGKRPIYFVGENEPQKTALIRSPESGGYGLDAVWNDDFHHATAVAMRGHADAYFLDYMGSPQELISSVKWGYLHQGQWNRWQKRRRGMPSFDIEPKVFINFIQNHDQIANTGLGKRISQLASPGIYRSLTALLLLGPATPMLFQGQEFCASAPFLYFADHDPELAELVHKGRQEFMFQFTNIAAEETQDYLFRPSDPEVFKRCKLDLSERESHHESYALHRDLLKMRREDPVFSHSRKGGVDGAVLSENAFVLRFFSEDGKNDSLLMINLGRDLWLSPVSEPLVAPHQGRDWRPLWSSEHPRYGGQGTIPQNTNDTWRMPGHAAIVFIPGELEEKNSAG